MKGMRALLPPAWTLLIGFAVASLLILAAGGAPLAVYRLFAAGTWGQAYGIGQVLFKTTPLVFTGLAVAVGLRAGLFNIGAIERIHAELAHARIAGRAVLLISADLDELLALSDRIGVLYRGRVAGCVDNVPERRAEVRSEVASLMVGAGA